jgi:hypothetical protein
LAAAGGVAVAAVLLVRQLVDADATAQGETRLALALVADTVLGGRIANLCARAAVLRVFGDVHAAAAAVQGPVGTLTFRARALLAAGADRVAVAAVLVVEVGVEATTVALFVELRIEEVGVAYALTVFAQ